VFGKVTQGTEVVDAIKAVKTTRSGMFSDVPAEDIIIEKVEAA
jgi:peptidyl-prolyl cis-trans isomerase B (cyclophilin B)